MEVTTRITSVRAVLVYSVRRAVPKPAVTHTTMMRLHTAPAALAILRSRHARVRTLTVVSIQIVRTATTRTDAAVVTTRIMDAPGLHAWLNHNHAQRPAVTIIIRIRLLIVPVAPVILHNRHALARTRIAESTRTVRTATFRTDAMAAYTRMSAALALPA